MNVYQNGQNWVIEEKIDLNLVEKILSLIDENLHNLLKDKNGYSTKGENADQYWLNDGSFQFNNKKFEEIKTQYKKEIITKLEKSTLLNTKIFNCINLKDSSCWSVIGEENSYHAIHCHNVNKLGVNGISTVLYLKVPQKNSQKDPVMIYF